MLLFCANIQIKGEELVCSELWRLLWIKRYRAHSTGVFFSVKKQTNGYGLGNLSKDFETVKTYDIKDVLSIKPTDIFTKWGKLLLFKTTLFF